MLILGVKDECPESLSLEMRVYWTHLKLLFGSTNDSWIMYDSRYLWSRLPEGSMDVFTLLLTHGLVSPFVTVRIQKQCKNGDHRVIKHVCYSVLL